MYRELELQNSPLKLIVDEGDFLLIKDYKWSISPDGYARATINKKRYYIHRFLIPNAKIVDHINGNTLDNRRENLREASFQQNIANSFKKPGLSIYKGVSYDKNSKRKKRWMARCEFEGRNITIGRYFTEEEAALAYNEKAIELWKDFAVINDIKNKRQVRYSERK